MGAYNRNIEFAKFIKQHFPKATSCLVVADGKGELATLLSSKYHVRVVENKPRQETYRKRVKYTKGWFDRSQPINEDIVVGMHPDEATAEIIVGAEGHGKKWAVVPCCLKGPDAYGIRGFQNWVAKLKSLSKGDVLETTLPFEGKNTVLWINSLKEK